MYKKEIEKIGKAQKEIKGKIEFILLEGKLNDIYIYIQLLQKRCEHGRLPNGIIEELERLEKRMKNIGYWNGKFDEWWEEHRNDSIRPTPKE